MPGCAACSAEDSAGLGTGGARQRMRHNRVQLVRDEGALKATRGPQETNECPVRHIPLCRYAAACLCSPCQAVRTEACAELACGSGCVLASGDRPPSASDRAPAARCAICNV